METQDSDDPSPLRGLFALLRAGALLALVIVSCGAHALTKSPDGLDRFVKWDFRTKPVTPADVAALSDTQLEYLRGIVFGKHGRVFRGEIIQDYLIGLSWYRSNPDYSNSMLNDVERKSIDVIREAEARKHKTIRPGDLRFWAMKPIAKANLGKPGLLDLHIMSSEVEAIHGKRFTSDPAMQAYFDDRYWYKPAAKYNPKGLSPTERQNLKLLQAMEKERRKAGIAPGDMILFEIKPLRASDLRNVGLFDLRVLRNEIFARRGYKFRTPWLEEWFGTEEWYEPVDDQKAVKLTQVDNQNLQLILKREAELHEALSSRKVKPAELGDLFAEDLRKLRDEIYARRGKVFKSRWQKSYFASMPWYKPNPRFSVAMLNSIERANLATIKRLEKRADSEMGHVEG
jgi:hypothetical protein